MLLNGSYKSLANRAHLVVVATALTEKLCFCAHVREQFVDRKCLVARSIVAKVHQEIDPCKPLLLCERGVPMVDHSFAQTKVTVEETMHAFVHKRVLALLARQSLGNRQHTCTTLWSPKSACIRPGACPCQCIMKRFFRRGQPFTIARCMSKAEHS